MAGGGAYITAAHLASLGRPAALLTRLGLDPLSQSLNTDLEAGRIELTFVERSPDAGPRPTVALVRDEVNVVDTTGAGDAFNAGFLHSWLNTSDLERSLAAGIQAGGLSVQSPGGAPPP